MNSYASYVESQESANAFVKQAESNVANYVNTGRSELGKSSGVVVSDGSRGSGSESTHFVSFTMFIKPNAEGSVPVSLDPWVSDYYSSPIRIHVPLDVIEGK